MLCFLYLFGLVILVLAQLGCLCVVAFGCLLYVFDVGFDDRNWILWSILLGLIIQIRFATVAVLVVSVVLV